MPANKAVVAIAAATISAIAAIAMSWASGCDGRSSPGASTTQVAWEDTQLRVPLGEIDVPEGTPEGEWLKIGDDNPLLWCFRGGRRLVFEQSGPRVYLSIDGKPSKLVGVIVRSESEMLLVDKLPAQEATDLMLWVYSPHLKHLAKLTKPQRVGGIHVWELEDQEILKDLTPVSRCLNLRSLCARDCPELEDISPLAGLPKLSSVDLYETKVSSISPLRGCPIEWLDVRRRWLTNRKDDYAELTHLKSLICLNADWIEERPWPMHEILPKLPLLSRLWVTWHVHSAPYSTIAKLPSLGRCPRLTSLTLEDTRHLDLSPLEELAELIDLDLIGRTDPSTSLRPIAKLKGLRSLRIEIEGASDEITDLTPLAEAKGLARLVIITESSTIGHDRLGELPNLTHLTLGSSSLERVPTFKSPMRIRHLDFVTGAWVYNNLKDISSLSETRNLETLILRDCDDVEDWASLGRLKELRHLDLGGTSIESLDVLAGLENLEVLSLAQCKLDDLSPLAGLKALRKLDIQHVHKKQGDTYAPIALDAIARLPNLVSLDLPREQTAGIKKLALPSLRRLSLPVDATADEFRHVIRAHPDLVCFRAFTGANLNDSVIDVTDELAKLKNLHTLEIAAIKDASVIAGLEKLTHLEAPAVRGPSDMTALRRLVHLRYLRWPFEEPPDALPTLPNLFKIRPLVFRTHPSTPTDWESLPACMRERGIAN